jgi:hypothetical protein
MGQISLIATYSIANVVDSPFVVNGAAFLETVAKDATPTLGISQREMWMDGSKASESIELGDVHYNS